MRRILDSRAVEVADQQPLRMETISIIFVEKNKNKDKTVRSGFTTTLNHLRCDEQSFKYDRCDHEGYMSQE